MSDARHILQNHYKDASRLDARIQLHAKYSTNTQGLHAWVFEHLLLPPTWHRYADALVVPEAEPLVAYVKSIGVLTEDELVRFQSHVEEIIERQGPIHINKSVGMFEACQSNTS